MDGGIEAALSAAFEAAGDRDVLVGGGAATIRQYLRASLIDEMHLAIVPVLLGSGERLFDDLSQALISTAVSNASVRQPLPISASHGLFVTTYPAKIR